MLILENLTSSLHSAKLYPYGNNITKLSKEKFLKKKIMSG